MRKTFAIGLSLNACLPSRSLPLATIVQRRRRLGEVMISFPAGAAKRAEGNAEHDAAAAKGYAEGVGDKVMGTVKNTVGSVIGDKSMEAEGKAREVSRCARSCAGPSTMCLSIPYVGQQLLPCISVGRPCCSTT